MIHLAVKRIKQHRQGEPYLIEAKNKEVVMTLREIAAGEVTFTNVEELPELNDLDALEEEQEAKEGSEA